MGQVFAAAPCEANAKGFSLNLGQESAPELKIYEVLALVCNRNLHEGGDLYAPRLNYPFVVAAVLALLLLVLLLWQSFA